MAKRWGVKNKINKRIAHLKWLLIKNQIPPPGQQPREREMEICKQQNETEMRHLALITICGYVGGRQI